MIGTFHIAAPAVADDITLRKQLKRTPASAQHLGMVRDTKSHGVYTTTEQNIKKGRRAAYRLLGAGLHRRCGLSPNVLKKMVTAYMSYQYLLMV